MDMRTRLGAGVGGRWQVWAKVGRSGWVRLIGLGLKICLVGGCGYACRSRGGGGWLWMGVGAPFSSTSKGCHNFCRFFQ